VLSDVQGVFVRAEFDFHDVIVYAKTRKIKA
jgi:hypothetical protein